ncbi:hypothetical protein J3R83DRAFT_6782 [Lanmaoa asiatica]|nr:hypothetical protein J3R83DRAFT_6782 [Lanmaoa asiatica]
MTSTTEFSGWPHEPAPLVGYLSRKALPIKRNDAEPLTREDVQFDLLDHIFSDTNAVFTSQAPGTSSKVNFRDLYVNALYHSSKCSKVLKDKMVETPAFASRTGQDLFIDERGAHQHNNGMYALVSRIMHGSSIVLIKLLVFPEMKTALRTYHPVPSLQKTDGNAQDAPRIKNCLKAALLPSELKSMPPSTPEEILEKSRARQLPPTSVVNLIFVLANHAAPLAATHFDPPLNFLDLFLPINISSADRARAFLWLVFHYLEGPDLPNPYDDDYSRQNAGKVPWLRRLTDAEMAEENLDTAEEIEWGRAMSAQRNVFLQRLVNSLENEKKAKNMLASTSQRVPESSSHRSRPSRQPHDGAREKPYIHYLPPQRPAPPSQLTERPAGSSSRGPQRTMLQHAWHVVASTDPLVDSDEELMDEYVRSDYNQRISVIARLRGRAPTPPPDNVAPPNSVSDTREHRWRTVQSWK